ncbi:MAG: DUF5719 family protein, partial [Ornithinimicrobium sp.]
APAVADPAVHVIASGGPVTAYLGDRWLAGTTDQGWEVSGPTADPATSHVITGVGDSALIETAPTPEAQAGETEASDRPPVPRPATLRVAVPGVEPAVIQLRALTDEGTVDLPTDVRLLPGEEGADIELTDLPAGTSALAVDSDEPVVVALQLRSAESSEGRADIAWVPSTHPIEGLAGTVLPQTGDDSTAIAYRLEVASPLGAQVRVHRVSDDGEVLDTLLDVPAGTGAHLDLSLAEAVWVEVQDGQAFAAVSAHSVVAVSDEDPTSASRTGEQSDQDNAAEVDEVTLISVLPLNDLPRYRSLVDLVPRYP